jgi:putative oxidoreductase
MRKVVIEIIAALLVLLFLYASISKLLGFSLFVDEMNNQPFPNWMTPYLVVLIPGSEILAAAALLFDRTRMLGLYASFALLFVFTLYAALVLLNVFDYVPCSCGGMLKKLNWTQHLWFTSAFLLLSIIGILLFRKQRAGGTPHKLVSA